MQMLSKNGTVPTYTKHFFWPSKWEIDRNWT